MNMGEKLGYIGFLGGTRAKETGELGKLGTGMVLGEDGAKYDELADAAGLVKLSMYGGGRAFSDVGNVVGRELELDSGWYSRMIGGASVSRLRPSLVLRSWTFSGGKIMSELE